MTTAKENTASNEANNEQFIITTFKKEGGIDVVKDFLSSEFNKYSSKASSEVPEIDSEAGRKRIKALALEVNKKLSELDTPIRDYLRDIKKQPKLIEAIAKENKEAFTELRASILKPLADAQSSQDEIIAWLNGVPEMCSSPETLVTDLESALETINGYSIDLVWPELRKKFKVAHESALTTATVMLERAKESEEQAKRLAELEKQAEEQRQKDRDREVAEQAERKARQEEQAKAEQDRIDVDRRAAEAKQREENAKAAEAQAKRDAEIAKENQAKAEANAKEAAKLAAELAATEKAEAIELAKQQEAKRIADEEAAQAQAAKDRENDKAHKIAINRAALVDLIAAGVDEEVAKTVIRAIGRKEVRNISIQY